MTYQDVLDWVKDHKYELGGAATGSAVGGLVGHYAGGLSGALGGAAIGGGLGLGGGLLAKQYLDNDIIPSGADDIKESNTPDVSSEPKVKKPENLTNEEWSAATKLGLGAAGVTGAGALGYYGLHRELNREKAEYKALRDVAKARILDWHNDNKKKNKIAITKWDAAASDKSLKEALAKIKRDLNGRPNAFFIPQTVIDPKNYPFDLQPYGKATTLTNIQATDSAIDKFLNSQELQGKDYLKKALQQLKDVRTRGYREKLFDRLTAEQRTAQSLTAKKDAVRAFATSLKHLPLLRYRRVLGRLARRI